MKKMMAVTLFMLATLAWAAAQTGGATDASGQTTSPSAQAPSSQTSAEPTAQAPNSQPTGQAGAPAPSSQAPSASPSQGGMASPTVTEGCLGGTSPNYTITNSSGTTYKLNIPPAADASKLAAHVGEAVAVAGNVNATGSPSIDVQGIGRGTTTCPGSGSRAPQAPPK